MLVFFIALFPVSNIALIIGTIAAERFLYVPSLGWAGVLALAAAILSRSCKENGAEAAFGAAMRRRRPDAVLYGCRTWMRNIDWQNRRHFWAVTSETSPAASAHCSATPKSDTQQGATHRRNSIPRKGQGNRPRQRLSPFGLGDVYLIMQQRASRPERAGPRREIYRTGHTRSEGGLELAREEVLEIPTEARAFHPDKIIFGDVHLHERLAYACYLRAVYDIDPAGIALEEGEKHARTAIFMRCTQPTASMVEGDILIRARKALSQEDPKRKRLYEDAIVSLLRALVFDKKPADLRVIWSRLNSCYAALGLPPAVPAKTASTISI